MTDPIEPSPLSSEARALLRAATKPRPMTLAERKLAAQAVAKIASGSAGALSAGSALAKITTSTIAKLAAGAIVIGSTAWTMHAVVARDRAHDRPATQHARALEPRRTASPASSTSSTSSVGRVALEAPVPTSSAPTSVASSPLPSRERPSLITRSAAEPLPSTPPARRVTLSPAPTRLARRPHEALIEPEEQRETAALQMVFSLLSTDPRGALSLLSTMDREFAQGRLQDERECLWALALDRAGRSDEARARAEAALARAPMSMYAPRLRALLARPR